MSTYKGIVLKKSLGQNFLFSSSILRKMARIILDNASISQPILEIGSGSGNLTMELLAYNHEVVAIEIDERWCKYLRGKHIDNLHIIHGDFMQITLDYIIRWNSEKWVLTGNIPYHLSGSILEKIVMSKDLFSHIFLLLPSPISNRISASICTKDRSRLSVLVQTAFEIKTEMKIPSSSFRPIPDIDSKLIRLTPLKNNLSENIDWAGYRDFIKLAFSSKRKTLRSIFSKMNMEFDYKTFASCRAEELSIEQFLHLFESYLEGK
ncbi:MAG: ribosomal RNA small subunit methyltransferase A [Candidatus Coatesbacteria bacterium]|nr:ribosomal RNA small subunit methyltransferase A [Candidatus Coatesbacteria bacterium]